MCGKRASSQNFLGHLFQEPGSPATNSGFSRTIKRLNPGPRDAQKKESSCLPFQGRRPQGHKPGAHCPNPAFCAWALPQPREAAAAAAAGGQGLPLIFVLLPLPDSEPLVLGDFLCELTLPAPVTGWEKQDGIEAQIQGLETQSLQILYCV